MEAKKKLEREARAYVEKALAHTGKRPSNRTVSRAVRKIVENFEGISYGENSRREARRPDRRSLSLR